MDVYKKLLEYEEMLNDGVISEAEFQKLKSILYSGKMAELGIQDEIEFENYIKKDVFKEAILMLENNTIASHREAIFWLEKLGDWGNAAAVIEQCKAELSEMAKEELYNNAIQIINKKNIVSYNEAIADLESLGEWKDAKEIVEKTKLELSELERKKAESAKEELYNNAIQKINKKTFVSYNEAIADLVSLGDYKNSQDLIEKSKLELSNLEKIEKKVRHEFEQEKKKTMKIIVIVVIIVACFTALHFLKEIKLNKQYQAALELYEQGKYDEAISAFEALDGYKDSAHQIMFCRTAKNAEIYSKAKRFYYSEQYEQALKLFESISGYKDSKTQIQHCEDAINESIYQQALSLLNEKKYEEAITELTKIPTYKDSSIQIDKATEALNSEKE